MKKALLIILTVLLADQALKIWVKTNMYLGQEFPLLGEWFIIHFTENNGMAFGLQFGGELGKLALSLFRIVAVGGIFWYLYKITRKPIKIGLLISVSLILAGALGNIIDSAFYGLIFNDSYDQIAELFPEEGGYASFLHGRVVDMLYFPLINGTWPDWVPVWGGENFMFFRPVFNLADTAITTGIGMILVFQKRYFEEDAPERDAAESDESITTSIDQP